MENFGSSWGDAEVKIKFGFIRGLKNSYFNIHLKNRITQVFIWMAGTKN